MRLSGYYRFSMFKKSKQLIMGKKKTTTTDDIPIENEVKQKQANKKGSEQNSEVDDDVHALRLTKALGGLDEFSTDFKDQRNNFRFNFLREMAFKQLPLSDLNIIYYNADTTLHKSSRLAYNLEHIVKNPGIYPFASFSQSMQNDVDRHYLQNIYPSEQLKLDRFDIYIPPSKDVQLREISEREKSKFIMSTSTISNFMMMIYYALSGYRNPYFETVFEQYQSEPKRFMISQRKPISNIIHRSKKQDGSYVYSVDGDKGLFKVGETLMNVGKIVERQITMTKDEFEKRFVAEEISPDLPPLEDHHRFMKLNDEILLRSQIDCYSYDENGNPFVFEIKSRAGCPIRYDFSHCLDYTDYTIDQQFGLSNSYEREYYDLIRGAFLKWSIQMRIGRMSGAFIAYHNIKQIQGFEYVSQAEIDNRIYGSTHYAETIFLVGSRLITTILNELFDDHLKSEQWESVKMGVYAAAAFRKIMIFTELFKTKEDLKKYVQVVPEEGLVNEYDYFTKVQPLENKVLKFDVHLKITVNGVEQAGPCIPFKKGDQLNVQYLIVPQGEAQFADYMNFLHDCYKFEDINSDMRYAGAWLKNPSF